MPGPSRWPPAAVGLALVAAMLATMASFADPPRGDATRYRLIADAAPGTPDLVESAYADRFIPHWLVGVLPGPAVHTGYVIGLALVVLALVLVLHRLLEDLHPATYVLCFGLVVLHPYVLRPYLQQPGTFQDLVFVLGAATAVLGVLRERPPLVVAGVLLGLCGRQTALLLAPVLTVWVWPRSRGVAVVLVAATAALYLGISAFVEPWSKPFAPGLGDTVLNRLGNPGALASHVGRTAVPLLVPLAVLIALVVRRPPAPALWALLVAALIVAQPLAIDPAFPGFASNEQRLAALGIVPLVAAIAVLARDARNGSPLLIAGLLVVFSLHHVFTSVGPGSLAQFVVVQLLVAAALGALTWRTLRPSLAPR